VIHYEYLWDHERTGGEERGLKRRPCAIVVALRDEAGEIRTLVAPITHKEPVPPAEGIEIPSRVKRSLALDGQRSWVIVTDLNSFTWPGIDVYPVPSSPPGTFDYGYLPPILFEQIRKRIEEIGSAAAATARTEV